MDKTTRIAAMPAALALFSTGCRDNRSIFSGSKLVKLLMEGANQSS